MAASKEARAHVRRVETYCEYVALLAEVQTQVNRTFDVLYAKALELSPETNKAA